MSAETPTTPVNPVAAAAAAPPPAAPPLATPAAAPDRHDPARAASDIHVGSGPARADWRPNSAAATRPPAPSRSSCWPPRARSKTPCGFSERRRRRHSTPSGHREPPWKSVPSGTRSRERSRACWLRSRSYRAGPSSSRSSGGINLSSSRKATRSPFGHRRFSRSAISCRPSSPARVRPFHPCIEPGRRHGRDDRRAPGRTDVARDTRRAAPAQELRRGDHPADARDTEESAH